MRNRRGTTLELLQSHLSFFCFCYRYKEADPFIIFMKSLTMFNNSFFKQSEDEDNNSDINK
ncbi:hypothetical protein A0H76_2233 [Hepatospora eriocheir]|uniref:Uncharacterized protein n=1 Tax=Hepatospora eriocheir TaxID=1081669 RepID=A0A1X0QFZ9_9MICR|nr:hypothetical protein A0H76_2233 [Hepatospora eriocheir]